MNIKYIKYERGCLLLRTDDPDMELLEKFKPGAYDIVKHSEKRSNKANSYMWALCKEIGDAVGLGKEEVYRNAVREGNVFKDIWIHENAADTFEYLWRNRGTAWFTERVDAQGEYVVIRAYYGSSTYNVRQMQKLIDRLLQDAEAVGIPTPEEDYIRKLMEDYERQSK